MKRRTLLIVSVRMTEYVIWTLVNANVKLDSLEINAKRRTAVAVGVRMVDSA